MAGTGDAQIQDELELLVAAGLTPAEALRSATLEPAKYLDAAESLGATTPKVKFQGTSLPFGNATYLLPRIEKCGIWGNTKRLCSVSAYPKLVNEHKDRTEVSGVGNRKH